MDGVHDMGGMQGFGPVVTADGGRTHHHSWEVRAQVVSLLAGRSMRADIERLGPDVYLDSSYYVRWLLAAERRVVDDGMVSADDLERWRSIFADDSDAEMPYRSDPAVVALIGAMQPELLEPVTESAFEEGERVRVRRMRPEQHHRCPRYVRGAVGLIERVLGADRVPGVPYREHEVEPCYTVQFSSVDLFGDDQPSHQLLIDLWERYLEPVT